MSEEDNFKTAKNISLDSAVKILDGEVKNFLRDNFKNLDDDDISEIIERFLNVDEPRFVRENLPDNEMICYAYIDAEINLDDLNNFMKNFDVFKLEKKVEDMQKIIDGLNNKFELYQEFLPEIIERTLAIKNNTNNAIAYFYRGLAYYNLKNYDQAIKDYSKAIELDSDYAWAYSNRGLVYYDLQNYEQAISDYDKALELNPIYIDAYNNRGNAYLVLRNYSRAISDYTEAIKIDPNFAMAYNNRGVAYEEFGEIEKAEKNFAKARELGFEY